MWEKMAEIPEEINPQDRATTIQNCSGCAPATRISLKSKSVVYNSLHSDGGFTCAQGWYFQLPELGFLDPPKLCQLKSSSKQMSAFLSEHSHEQKRVSQKE